MLLGKIREISWLHRLRQKLIRKTFVHRTCFDFSFTVFPLSLSPFPFPPIDVDFYENPLRAEKSSAPRDCNAALETRRCSSLVCEFLGQCCL